MEFWVLALNGQNLPFFKKMSSYFEAVQESLGGQETARWSYMFSGDATVFLVSRFQKYIIYGQFMVS